MSIMSFKGFLARVEFDAEDELFVGHIANIDDVIGFHADSVAGLKSAFHEAVDDYLDTCAKAGKVPDKPYSGNLMLRVPPAVHARAALAAKLSGRSMNEWGAETLDAAAERFLKEAL
jgi:predicted HicB family RNase H-like nuclease